MGVQYRSDQTLSPDMIVEGFSDLYRQIYSQEPQVVYMGNSWYRVNGELVHRSALLSELDRLRDIVTYEPPLDRRSIVQRLIARLRNL